MYVRRALSGTPVGGEAPPTGRPQPPIYPLQIGGTGGWRAVRTSPADGACGVHGYPCEHPGVDVAGVAGTQVVAPETGTIVGQGDGSAAPFVGYGPWWVLIQGDSGPFHLLAHLDPMTQGLAPLGAAVIAGQPVGTTSSANHTHWEVRRKPTPDPGESNIENNTDPIAWLSLAAVGLGTVLLVGGAVALFLLLRRRSS